MTSTQPPSLPPDAPTLLERYFCDYLLNQRRVSRETIASYRDTFRLFLRFREHCHHKPPATLTLADLDAKPVLAFLDYLEQTRHNSIRAWNVRLAAIRAFLQYAALQEPTALASIRRTLAIPLKRCDRPSVAYLSKAEITALLNAPNSATWSGHRDRVMLATLYNTGARVSELIRLNVEDFQVGPPATLHIHGKGRKERIVPIWKRTTRQLTAWLRRTQATTDTPLFPSRQGRRLTRAGVRTRLDAAVTVARQTCASLRRHRVSPHLLRHTIAMHLLQSGVDITVIALWLGHASTATTHMYVEADLSMKKRAIDKISTPLGTSPTFRPRDRLLAFLESL